MAGIRTDIAKLGGPWSQTMVWYARAVRELRSRALVQSTSWTYLAAIHGIDPQGWLNQNILPANTPAPPQDEMGRMFNQCQHASWFFLPWHRGYLHAFETIIADWIADQGGPSDWALPYWNYLNSNDPNSRNIPREFLDSALPDGTPNSLADALRGPATLLGPQTWIPVDITLTSQTSEVVYTSEPGTLGYGGPISGFAQQGNAYGATESDPHNLVHVMVGGDNSPSPQGWMWDPNFAALDPIFWVHHCNVDRLWAAWMTNPVNSQEVTQPWRNGPFPRQFAMPDAAGNFNVFIPTDTLPGSALDPAYDDLRDGTGIVPGPGGLAMAAPLRGTGTSNLVGANSNTLTVRNVPTTARIKIAPPPVTALAATGNKRVYLNLEGVKGSSATGVIKVVLTGPDGNPAEALPEAVKTVAFFGLANATSAQGPHAGNGLSATVEISDFVRRIEAESQMDKIEAHIAQPSEGAEDITVDRISIYVRAEP